MNYKVTECSMWGEMELFSRTLGITSDIQLLRRQAAQEARNLFESFQRSFPGTSIEIEFLGDKIIVSYKVITMMGKPVVVKHIFAIIEC